MSDRRQSSGWRAPALAVALFAITLNFLQPLAHAALLRDGAPSTLWSIFCNAAPHDSDKGVPLAQEKHECCLGLAHAVAFAAPSAPATAIELPSATLAPLQATEVVIAVGIRDGPHRPRGPPSFV